MVTVTVIRNYLKEVIGIKPCHEKTPSKRKPTV